MLTLHNIRLLLSRLVLLALAWCLIGCPKPVLNSVTPDAAEQGKLVELILKGDNFDSSCQVILKLLDDDTPRNVVSLQLISSTEIRASIDIQQAPPGAYSIEVAGKYGVS